MVLLNAQNAHCSAVAWERTVQAVGDSVLLQTFLTGTLLPDPAAVTQKNVARAAVSYAAPHIPALTVVVPRAFIAPQERRCQLVHGDAVSTDKGGHGREAAVEQQDNPLRSQLLFSLSPVRKRINRSA
jgi:hypothetical protein